MLFRYSSGQAGSPDIPHATTMPIKRKPVHQDLILAVDIGNSRIKTGIFAGTRLKIFAAMPTVHERFTLPDGFDLRRVKIAGIASVVPSAVKRIADVLREHYHLDPVIIHSGECGVTLRVKSRERVGIDRVLNARAAHDRHGGPLIIADIGSAATVDLVSERGEFLGGAIMPGPDLWLSSLAQTALLPKTTGSGRTYLPGRDTEEAIRAGLRFGYPAAIGGIIRGFLRRFPHAKIILTGGAGSVVHRLDGMTFSRSPHLTLTGIALVLDHRARTKP